MSNKSKNVHFPKIKRTMYQTLTPTGFPVFPGSPVNQNEWCSSISRLIAYQNDLCSNICIIPSHPDGFSTYKNICFNKTNPKPIQKLKKHIKTPYTNNINTAYSVYRSGIPPFDKCRSAFRACIEVMSHCDRNMLLYEDSAR